MGFYAALASYPGMAGLASDDGLVRGRKAWQQFKKLHPTFEKSKSFKADLGPNIDNYLKTFAALVSNVQQTAALQERARTQLNQMRTILNAYEVIVKQANDPAMKRDFEKVKELLLEP
jgi:hypothetical protein